MVVYAIMVLFTMGAINPALAVSEDDKDNVMIRIGQMLLTGNYSIPTPPLWYQNNSWLVS